MERHLVRAVGHTLLAGFMWMFACVALTMMTTADFAAVWLFGSAAAAVGYLTWVYRRWKADHGVQDHKWHFAGEQALIAFIIANVMMSISMGFIVLGESGEFPIYENIGVLFFLGMLVLPPAYFIGRLLSWRGRNRSVTVKTKRKPKLKNEQLAIREDDHSETLADLLNHQQTDIDRK